MFQGVLVALVTPFQNGEVDFARMERHVEFLIAQGVDGIVPCGTTGESATLSHVEHKEVIRRVVAVVAGRAKVLAGTGSNATSESIELTMAAKLAGADGALLITPYYNKPTQEGLYQHYAAVARAVDLPLVPYNVPGRTGVDLLPDTVARLAETFPTIVGLKEATGSMERASVLHVKCGDRLALLSGDDATFMPFLAVGGLGVISVSANILPGPMVDLWRKWMAGDGVGALRRHEELLEVNRGLFCETNPIPVKAAAHWMGFCGPELRLPLTFLSSQHHAGLKAILGRLGLELPQG